MAGNSPHLPQDTIDRSIRILLMPDPDGHAADSDWEALDAQVKELHERVSLWADSVRAHVKEAPGDLPPGCVGRFREKWRPLVRVAEWRTGMTDIPGRTWCARWRWTILRMRRPSARRVCASRRRGWSCSRTSPRSGRRRAVRGVRGTRRAARRPQLRLLGTGPQLRRQSPQEAQRHPARADGQAGHQHHVEATGWWRHTTGRRARLRPGLAVLRLPPPAATAPTARLALMRMRPGRPC